MDTLDKGVIYILDRENFIMLLRMAHNIKLMNCLFLKFSINIFGLQLTLGN